MIKKLNDNLKKIQSKLEIIFNLLKIPFLQKIDTINPITEEILNPHKSKILNNLKEVLIIFKEIQSDKLVQITDFKAFSEKMIPIIEDIKVKIEKSQSNEYNNLYIMIKLYWFIEYFIKHELELKNNEFFNEGCHYKWIIDDICLDFLINLENNPNSSINVLAEIDDKRRGTIRNTKLIEIKDKTVGLTSLGQILCDIAKIGDIYCYYLDEFDEILEESEE